MTVTAMPAQGTPPEQPEETGRSRKKLVLAAVLVLALAAGGWFLFLKPPAPTDPVPGEVMVLEPIQINLAAGHYLRVGLALQLVEEAHETDGSRALDSAISVFSGLEVSEVTRAEQRERLRFALLDQLDEHYDGEVLEVYFTEFVTQ